MTPGWDVAGVVDAVGDNAPAAVGDEVFGGALVGGVFMSAIAGKWLDNEANRS